MNFVVIEFLVFFVPLLGFAIWEYLKVSRDLRELADTDESDDSD